MNSSRISGHVKLSDISSRLRNELSNSTSRNRWQPCSCHPVNSFNGAMSVETAAQRRCHGLRLRQARPNVAMKYRIATAAPITRATPTMMIMVRVFMRSSGLTKKAEPPPTRDVNRDSGTDSANGGWLRRLVRPHGHSHTKASSKTICNTNANSTPMTAKYTTSSGKQTAKYMQNRHLQMGKRNSVEQSHRIRDRIKEPTAG